MEKKWKGFMSNSIGKKNESMWFILYAFVSPFICISLVKNIPGCRNGLPNLLLFGAEAAAPFLAVLLAVFQARGYYGLGEYLKDKYIICFSWKLGAIAFIVPAFILTLAKLITWNMGYDSHAFLVMPDGRKFIVIAWALLAEEVGWRGFLQDKVDKKVKDIFAPLVIGLVWWIWHYHYFLSGTMNIPLLVLLYGCIVESYGYYVITKLSKGNVIPASIWHFSGNLFFNLYLFNPEWNNGHEMPYIIANLCYSLNLIFFICFMIYKKKTNKLEE